MTNSALFSRVTAPVLGAPIDALCGETAATRILRWAAGRESRYICIVNAHSVVSTTQDAAFFKAVSEADMSTPDGAPVAWMLRRQGFAGQPRVSGPDLMWSLFERCSTERIGVYFYGSTAETLARLRDRLATDFPALRIEGMESPPFRPLDAEEDAAAVDRINASGVGIVFVGLGCPKQEKWMADHRGRVEAVMIGVGAAFDFHAGTVSRAPAWMRDNGLEWLHRLASEPRRLWRRYLVTNTLFVVGAIKQLIFGHAR
ncbi:WecB/TagA/CpsF family glycosyltransferase [Dechloromonas sp. HYN0024]|uniref:WecB/TagA/CpsF family glycosyltransferase n=1 Tax=Dechloromonas sp. HYN0024 TaxID=2231055 RepID=UPI000E43A8F7|nr:WecB/TagA/CpsF family glycosyltransferase [Dechloromonas sp. HYN0024]AXS80118.1 glycosyltransferase [Dechloromonas sp. HYN0024]